MLVQTRLDQTMERLRNTERAVLEVGKKIWEVGSEVRQISLRLAYDPKEIMEVKPKKGWMTPLSRKRCCFPDRIEEDDD